MVILLLDQPLFKPGTLVRHRRYDYRGVAVALDPRCLAPEEWYQTNRTKPKRDQAWYHVLVHGAGHSTYAAQSSLIADDEAQAVVHPWLRLFFSAFADGRYQRNDREWPNTW
ncbi:MAG: heat shock protein HspQ [Planctomycetota bacterium]|jgi:heat shock protein HspQ|nr:heat shock protein HspQ [Planctomycetota bacterium]